MVDIVSIACATGFIGDAVLQIASKKFNMGGPTGWGLKEYFKQHGSAQSLFTAAGMLSMFYVFYIYILKLPLTYTNIAIYGIIIDYIFRRFVIFPSLKGYYQYFNHFWSAVWIAIPMIIPLFLYLKFKNTQ